ncbi:hypothetical protein [Mucilaginibacter psychrotolerans]|uniref:hypothetical protein n=1 Tax=Mucilaginibacter psychrotolerans TaxID=1524096 RepID=UPI00106FD1C6|nr:hypothetical protein [Mucilaginibacter psychrotolerans]
MNRKNIAPIVIFFSIMVINVTTMLKGIKHHEDYLVIIGSIGCGLIMLAFILTMAKLIKANKRQQGL